MAQMPEPMRELVNSHGECTVLTAAKNAWELADVVHEEAMRRESLSLQQLARAIKLLVESIVVEHTMVTDDLNKFAETLDAL